MQRESRVFYVSILATDGKTACCEAQQIGNDKSVLRMDLGDGREDGSVLRGAADWQRQQGCVRRGIYALVQYMRKGFFLASILYIEVL